VSEPSREAYLVLRLLANAMDTKRQEVQQSMDELTMSELDWTRLQGMQAGLVWARMLLQETARAAGIPIVGA